MKHFLSALLFVLAGQISKGQTYVGATISGNTTWSLTGSPYIISANTKVNSNCTLTIDPGVVVKFDPTGCLEVTGVLKAIGNSSNKIVFTSTKNSPAPGDWGYSLFNNQSSS